MDGRMTESFYYCRSTEIIGKCCVFQSTVGLPDLLRGGEKGGGGPFQ